MAEWKQANFTVIPADTLNPINEKLDAAIAFLDTLSEALDAISDLVSILGLIESLISDFFGFLLSGIIDDFNRMINDFKYAGVYALDLTSHNWIGKKTRVRRNDEDPKVPFAANISTDEDVREARSNIEFTAPKVPFTSVGGQKVNSTGTKWDILAYYKRQTYREWLKVLTDALADENDLPSFKAWNDLINGKAGQQEPLNKTDLQVEIGQASPHPYEANYLRPGRPNFGPTGHIDCYVFAFAVGDILTFLQTLGAFSKAFYDVTSVDEYTAMYEKLKATADALKTGIIKDVTQWDLLPGEYQNQRGTPPDFIGISAGQILAPLFAILERLTKKLKSLFKTVNTGIAQFIEEIIKTLQQQIDELREIVRILKQLIQLLSDLLNLNGLYMLHVSTDEGVDGLIQELNAATGFKGDSRNPNKHGSANPKLYIGGAMFCYGYPSTDSKDYNLSKAWDDRRNVLTQKQVNIADKYNRSTDTLKRLFS